MGPPATRRRAAPEECAFLPRPRRGTREVLRALLREGGAGDDLFQGLSAPSAEAERGAHPARAGEGQEEEAEDGGSASRGTRAAAAAGSGAGAAHGADGGAVRLPRRRRRRSLQHFAKDGPLLPSTLLSMDRDADAHNFVFDLFASACVTLGLVRNEREARQREYRARVLRFEASALATRAAAQGAGAAPRHSRPQRLFGRRTKGAAEGDGARALRCTGSRAAGGEGYGDEVEEGDAAIDLLFNNSSVARMMVSALLGPRRPPGALPAALRRSGSGMNIELLELPRRDTHRRPLRTASTPLPQGGAAPPLPFAAAAAAAPSAVVDALTIANRSIGGGAAPAPATALAPPPSPPAASPLGAADRWAALDGGGGAASAASRGGDGDFVDLLGGRGWLVPEGATLRARPYAFAVFLRSIVFCGLIGFLFLAYDVVSWHGNGPPAQSGAAGLAGAAAALLARPAPLLAELSAAARSPMPLPRELENARLRGAVDLMAWAVPAPWAPAYADVLGAVLGASWACILAQLLVRVARLPLYAVQYYRLGRVVHGVVPRARALAFVDDLLRSNVRCASRALGALLILLKGAAAVLLCLVPRGSETRERLLSVCAANLLEAVLRAAAVIVMLCYVRSAASQTRRRGRSPGLGRAALDRLVLYRYNGPGAEATVVPRADGAAVDAGAAPPRRLDEASVCSICLCGYEAGERFTQLPCAGAHAFHADCVKRWLQRCARCPLCNVPVLGDAAAAEAPGRP